jgi:CheY-like chemotaxis protein
LPDVQTLAGRADACRTFAAVTNVTESDPKALLFKKKSADKQPASAPTHLDGLLIATKKARSLNHMTPQILLVDDNALQAATRSTILTRAGFRVTVAQQAQEALLLLERPELQASICLLITDHLMPGMNGPQLVRSVRSTMPTLPVLVLSGLAGAETEYEGLEVSFHLKPFPPEELIRVTHRLIGNPVLRSA